MTKLHVFASCLAAGWVRVHFDPRFGGVVLPEAARRDDHHELVFEYGYGMPVPVEDLDANELGVSATLSLDRQAALTFVPWGAVFRIESFDGECVTLWRQDIPAEMRGGRRAATPKLGVVH